jgi:hypothetical protein
MRPLANWRFDPRLPLQTMRGTAEAIRRSKSAVYDKIKKGDLDAVDGRAEYVDSEKWCGDQRTKYAVVKVEATSFVLAVICVALALVLVSVMFPNEFHLSVLNGR